METGGLGVAFGNIGTSFDSRQNRVITKLGKGRFTEGVLTLPVDQVNTQSMLAGAIDIDGDADADADFIYANSNAQVWPVYNLARQLSWSGTPRVGKPVDFELSGPAYFLCFAQMLEPSLCGTSAVGKRRCLSIGQLDESRSATLTFHVPERPTVVGTS